MNLLVITQKVNKEDSNLGFFHNWILEFSKHCGKLTVLCLEEGNHNLSRNVVVKSLGKEKDRSKLRYIINFYKYIWQERNNYDYVFVHMNVEYIILGSFFWKLWKKKIGLWYMHKSVTQKLKWAEKLTDIIFTGSKDSFRLKTNKLKILHHGIDSSLFVFKNRLISQPWRFLTVGRISQSKNIDFMLSVISEIKKKTRVEPFFDIVGSPIYNKDKDYLLSLKNQAKMLGLNNINFIGAVPNTKLPQIYQQADIFLNFSDTGSLDKSILEAMACGALVISSNDSAGEFLPQELFIVDESPSSLSDRIVHLLGMDHTARKKELSEFVKTRHSLSDLVSTILSNYE